MSIRKLFILVSLCAATLIFCGHVTSVAGGAGGETTNGITATVYKSDNSPAAGAVVCLRKSDYIAEAPSLSKSSVYSADAVTDSAGRFEITGVDPGDYCVEAADGKSATIFRFSIGAADTLNLGASTMLPFGSITGTIDSLTSQSYVQVRGLECIAAVNAQGRFTIPGMPGGKFAIQLTSAIPGSAPRPLDSVTVMPAETTIVPAFQGMAHLAQIHINSSSGGANINETLIDFPLLVRLNSANFTFAQSTVDGRDVRFVNGHGAPLSYEIEQWDSAGATAAVWVKVDTISGNDSEQQIQMLWGASTSSATPSLSNGAAVFDTNDGYVGVWHLADTAADCRAVDATAHQLTLRPDSLGLGQAPTAGAIGSGRRFTGNWFDNLGANDEPYLHLQTMTLSVWVERDSQQVSWPYTNFIGKQNWALNTGFSYGIFYTDSSLIALRILTGADTSKAVAVRYNDMTENQWINYTATFDGAVLTFYRDGVAVSTTVQAPYTMNDDVSRLYVSQGLKGAIDEVRICNRAQSASWVTLSYQTQRADQRVVQVTKIR